MEWGFIRQNWSFRYIWWRSSLKKYETAWRMCWVAHSRSCQSIQFNHLDICRNWYYRRSLWWYRNLGGRKAWRSTGHNRWNKQLSYGCKQRSSVCRRSLGSLLWSNVTWILVEWRWLISCWCPHWSRPLGFSLLRLVKKRSSRLRINRLWDSQPRDFGHGSRNRWSNSNSRIPFTRIPSRKQISTSWSTP